MTDAEGEAVGHRQTPEPRGRSGGSRTSAVPTGAQDGAGEHKVRGPARVWVLKPCDLGQLDLSFLICKRVTPWGYWQD